MATILIRQLDDETKARLRMRAARNSRSMEEEARELLKGALRAEMTPRQDLAASIRRRFARLGGVELPKIEREPMPRPLRLGK